VASEVFIDNVTDGSTKKRRNGAEITESTVHCAMPREQRLVRSSVIIGWIYDYIYIYIFMMLYIKCLCMYIYTYILCVFIYIDMICVNGIRLIMYKIYVYV